MMAFPVLALAATMEDHKKCVNASAELGDLQDELDVLATQLRCKSVTQRDYDSKLERKVVQRESIISRTPHFWLRALISHPAVGMLITVSDCSMLEALTDVRCTMHNRADFDIVFSFAENNFFANKELTKTYRNKEWSGLRVGCDDIAWKEDMAPDGEFVLLDEHYGMHCQSFFSWFTTPDDSRQLGEVIRDEVLPNAVHLFLGSWHSSYELMDDTDSDSSTSTETAG